MYYGHHQPRPRKQIVYHQNPATAMRQQNQGYLTTSPPRDGIGGYMAPVPKPGSYISAATAGGNHNPRNRPVYLTNPATRMNVKGPYNSPSYLSPQY